MGTSDLLEKELKLRRLFTALVRNKGYEETIFYSDLFHFFGMRQAVSVSQARGLWKEYIQRIKGEKHHIILYIFIPFCRKRCEYCSLYKWIYTRESDLDRYVQSVIGDIQSFKGIFKDVKFKSLEFRGGTASILTPRQLKDILSEIHHGFSFEEQAQRTFECNPQDASPEKLGILADFGINSISLGVQSLDKAVLRQANRGYQSYDMVKKAVQNARKFPGVERISTDLMIGLYNDTPQVVLESFIKLAKLKVDSFLVTPLVLTSHYLKKHYNNRKDLFDQELEKKLRRFEVLVMPVAEQFGYTFIPLSYSAPDEASWYFTLKKNVLSDRKEYAFRDSDAPFDCLGLGTGSWSMMTNTVYYRKEGFLSKTQGPRESGYQGVFLHGKQGKVFYIVTRLAERGRVSIPEYKKRFGTDIGDDFKGPLSKLKKLGAIAATKEALFLTAREYDEKFTYLLFFINNQIILDEFDNLLAGKKKLSSGFTS